MTDNEMNAGQRMPEQSVDGYTEQQLRKGIAVIGIAGRFPGADNVTQYWQNIADGVNCIREIPPQRWSWQEYFGDPKKEANKTNVKWGGFINDMDKFDPLFFNISPKEAAYMDPQHRIFLQAVWHAIEDAGYRVSDFSGSKMGVYAGVSKNDYSELMRATHQPITPFISTGTVHSILTNRVSFLFDFRGRSEAVDTACSSSLVSLHNAIRDIHNGECDTAIVGGVNALLAPTMYISHAKSGMLSVDGQCKTFDADANGYVRSEGVGVLLLKPLAKALADNDQIYTVIKGSAINHGGRANFLTSPRTEAQAEVIGAALKDADVTPDSIQYVEAHGTGTPMGDPIEINGLKMAFSEAGQKQQKSCALSSAKSNVGHLESAAGIAAIIRVIMAMKHQTIPGLGNFNRINPYIELEDSPFYLATEPLVWKKGQQPRRAGVSSFGMGGVNAHVILEEPPQRKAPANSPYREFMAPLSAKKGQLKILVEELLARLDGEPQMKPQRLADICYTLQVGRDEHDERLALVFTSQTQWQQQLSAYLADCENGSITKITGSYYHRVVMKKGQRQKQINASPQPLNDIAAQWVQGAAVEWQSYYQDATPQRVSLGQYPFVKKTCWFENQTETVAQTTVVQQPLLRPYSQNGTVILAQDDFYLADHVVQGTPILPGVAYLELARHAAQQAKAQPLSGFKDIFWLSPLALVADKTEDEVAVKLLSKSGKNDFQIRYADALRCSGSFSDAPLTPLADIDIAAKQADCTKQIDKTALYQCFANNGLAYGPSFQVIESCHYSDEAIVTRLQLPELADKTGESACLHPSLLDGVFQTLTGLSLLGSHQSQQPQRQYVPFYLKSLAIHGPLTPDCFVYGRFSSSAATAEQLELDATLVNAQGKVLLVFSGLVKKAYGEVVNTATPAEIFYYSSSWQPAALPAASPVAENEPTTLLLLTDNSAQVMCFRQHSENKRVIWLEPEPSSAKLEQVNTDHYRLPTAKAESYRALFDSLKSEKISKVGIVYLLPNDSLTDTSVMFSVLYLTQALIKSRAHKQVRLRYLFDSTLNNPVNAMIGGFARTLSYENPKMDFASVAVAGLSTKLTNLDVVRIALNELSHPQKTQLHELAYRQGQRFSKIMVKLANPANSTTNSRFKQGGVYLISGGLGGLGAVFSRYLLQQYEATVLLLGRSGYSDKIEQKISAISNQAKNCHYYSADISDNTALTAIMAQINRTHPSINGVIHAAGLIEDAYILQKQPDSFARVLQPKIAGAVNLDRVLQHQSLDFFVLFSSIAALMPNQGQADYAAANSYLDEFAHYRNTLVAQQQRSGSTISINWPLWANGGMQVTAEEEAHLADAFGMTPLKNTDGIAILAQALALPSHPDGTGAINHLVAINGVEPTIDRCLGIIAEPLTRQPLIKDKSQTMNSFTTVVGDDRLFDAVERQVSTIVCRQLDINSNDFDCSLNLATLGIDSVAVLTIVKQINGLFALDIKPPLLFEVGSVSALATHLLTRYPQAIKLLPTDNYSRIRNDSLIDIEHCNQTSNICQRKFKTAEFYLKDHVVEGKFNMPGACYIEMGRQAAAFCRQDKTVVKLSNNYWISQLSSAGDDFNAFTEIKPGRDGRTDEYVIFSEKADGERDVHAIDHVVYGDGETPQEQTLVLSDVRQRCQSVQYPDQVYRQIISEGLEVGETFQPMHNIRLHQHEALAELHIPQSIAATVTDYVLHPSLLTGVFQTALISNRFENDNDEHYIPIGIDDIEVFAPMPSPCFVYCQSSKRNALNKDLRKFDIQVTDDKGHVVVALRGFALRALPQVEVEKTLTVPVVAPAHEQQQLPLTRTYLKQQLAQAVGLSVDEFDEFESFNRYGINSVMIVELNQLLEGVFGSLSKTLFFEYRNIDELAGYFIEEHSETLASLIGDVSAPELTAATVSEAAQGINTTVFIEQYLTTTLAKYLMLDSAELESDVLFAAYGINSVMIVELNQAFERHFGELSKTLLFEYRSIDELAEYFIEEHPAELAVMMAAAGIEQAVTAEPVTAESEMSVKTAKQSAVGDNDIAIIGVAGRYPGANNLDEFWQVLQGGKDCITAIPASHFNYQDCYDSDPEQDKIYAKWGGFIDNIDAFDASFFNISPREAALTDPQERIFLEVMWASLEDAGYTRAQLKQVSDNKVGVFVGALWQPYQAIGTEQTALGNAVAPSGLLYSIANRVSYYLDINGPSMAIDTACSSSLTALHLACQSINSGESKVAIVGGVNVSLHSSKYLFLSQNRFLSSDGRCRSFGAGGDGYVPGEGVGSLLLKPLQAAIDEGDRIHAVIKGSSINHGGKTHGYSVPNPNAQASLVSETLSKAAVDPSTISYIEAHGTGTSLGDPIEITGLRKAFAQHLSPAHRCAIGSVKSNIGHLEAAAGIAAVTKVILQMQHRQLVPTLHTDTLNPNIDFDSSGFKVVTQCEPWLTPQVTTTDGVSQAISRRAGISSFGAGGANAHIILEQYQDQPTHAVGPVAQVHVFVFSAKNEQRLSELLGNFSTWLDHHGDTALADVAYTLQNDREAMAQRLAVVASDADTLLAGINAYLSNDNRQRYYAAKVASKKRVNSVNGTEVGAGAGFDELAQAWCEGKIVNWSAAYLSQGQIISLPTYPFEKERHWIDLLPTNVPTNTLTITPANAPTAIPNTTQSKPTADAFTANFYHSQWQPTPLAAAQSVQQNANVVIIHDGSLDQRPFTSAAKVCFVRLGEGYQQSDSQYEVDRHSGVDLERVLAQQSGPLSVVFHCTAAEPVATTGYPECYQVIFNLINALHQSTNIATSRLLLLCVGDNRYLNALNGFTASLGLTGLAAACVRIEASAVDPQMLASVLFDELAQGSCAHPSEILYRHNRRYCKVVKLAQGHVGNPKSGFKVGGVYWITGGGGAIGQTLARFLLSRYQAKVILTGRSALDSDKQLMLSQLNQRGHGEVIYISADIGDRHSATTVLQQIKQRFIGLNGIIHAAGVFDEHHQVQQKSWREFSQTLAPKITATEVLDEISSAEKLDFFALFSSISALIGDFGQCDYALANAYLDGYAEHRQQLVRQGLRYGTSLSINWPLWQHGGMLNEADKQADYIKSSGLGYISSEQGNALFEQCVASDRQQHIIFAGQPALIEAVFDPQLSRATEVAVAATTSVSAQTSLVPSLAEVIREHIGKLIKLDPKRIDDDLSFSDLGIDSIRLKSLATALEQHWTIKISPSLFFEYDCVSELALYLSETFSSALHSFYQQDEVVVRAPASVVVQPTPVPQAPVQHEKEPVAIIGMAGVMPGAADLDVFWQNLVNGKDMISEVPASRWDWRKHYNAQPGSQTTVSKWGGFVDGVDYFDSLFFNISPTEAQLMDPQHRLFLQTVWHTIENAGYRTSELAGQAVGVFAGVQFQEYQNMIQQQLPQSSPHVATGNAHSMLTNRVSYLFDFKGPSESVDTACSSSLVAIHRAVRAIQNNECTMAIAGGVSLALSADTYVSTSQMGILSPDGRCKTFDKSANGYVKGEGAGAVLLKPLSQAQRDGDPICAVIKGVITRHGGKTSSLTAPSQKSQAALISELYRAENIDPATLGCIETHGTGTELGDPVEVDGLKQSFASLAPDSATAGYCALGSVKSNIGHLEPAAGIAGVFKVLLSLRHQTIPATLNVDELNPFIDLRDSPFYIATAKKTWQQSNNQPRRGGVSSFGFGGVNAHIVLEEYIAPNAEVTVELTPQLIVLSAKNDEALERMIRPLSDFIGTAEHLSASHTLANIAYTLQVGREVMDSRLAFVANDMADLAAKLNVYLQVGSSADGFITQGGIKDSAAFAIFDDEQANPFIGQMLQGWMAAGKWDKVGMLWASGLTIDWQAVLGARQRVALPGYPFAKISHWIPSAHRQAVATQIKVMSKTWEAKALAAMAVNQVQMLLVLANEDSMALADALIGVMPAVVSRLVKLGNRTEFSAGQIELSATSSADYSQLVKHLEGLSFSRIQIVDLADIYPSQSDPDRSLQTGPIGAKLALYQTLIGEVQSETVELIHLTQGLTPWQNASPTMHGSATAALVRMLGAEYARVNATTVDVDFVQAPVDGQTLDRLTRLINAELTSESTQSCYRQGLRFEPLIKAVGCLPTASKLSIEGDKVVVITGGTRGVGAAIAKHLASLGVRKMVIMGFEAIPAQTDWPVLLADPQTPATLREKLQHLSALTEAGVELRLYSGALTEQQSLGQYFADIRHSFGAIGGVIHSAGLARLNNPAFINKSAADIDAVLAPKVAGLLTLDKVFASDNLDYFIVFSSISALLPSQAVGVSDYAIANAYMDDFVACQRGLGRRYYQSIQWPSWKETGMGENTNPAYLNLGFTAHTTAEGLAMFDSVAADPSLAVSCPCVVEPVTFDSSVLLLSKPIKTVVRTTVTSASAVAPVAASSGHLSRLRRLFSNALNIAEEQLDGGMEFSAYGVDSILLAELVKVIEQEFSISLDSTILLENPTLVQLGEALSREYGDTLATLVEVVKPPPVVTSQPLPASEPVKQQSRELNQGKNKEQSSKQIAVIGIGCQFPEAQDKQSYWANLAEGKNCITEVPAERWSTDVLYSPQYRRGKSTSKWGGFISGIQSFDPLYFGISEDNAIDVDPLERKFLEVSVAALTDAGYQKDELWGKNVGVFVGSRVANYANLVTQHQKSSIVGLGQNFIAAYLSHHFNFTGPNMVVDTACSSSLVSIHLACQSLLSGETEVALAGGVDILLDEQPYLILSEARALSPTGRCHTFDRKADGFVPGEGAGAVLLKPLSKALADGDRIYGVIDSSAINNDGNTMGVTTPNPAAQQRVIEAALRKGNIDPATYGYMEAHGTGTMIGDPMELKSLTKAFRGYTDNSSYCGIGSVKSNLGHLLSAAGIASFIKVLLSVHQRQLPPTLNCAQPNERFAFDRSPFYLNRQLKQWQPINGVLRAGISGFGFGGTNAHIIVSDGAIPTDYQPVRGALPAVVFKPKRYWPAGSMTAEPITAEPIKVKQSDEAAVLAEYFDVGSNRSEEEAANDAMNDFFNVIEH